DRESALDSVHIVGALWLNALAAFAGTAIVIAVAGFVAVTLAVVYTTGIAIGNTVAIAVLFTVLDTVTISVGILGSRIVFVGNAITVAIRITIAVAGFLIVGVILTAVPVTGRTTGLIATFICLRCTTISLTIRSSNEVWTAAATTGTVATIEPLITTILIRIFVPRFRRLSTVRLIAVNTGAGGIVEISTQAVNLNPRH
ncbi:MAG TPA: hypothetical protein DCQ09_13195, partial [Alcanivorax sp.]|nr:hypothetical protein [Alcanivorax sp.]